MSQFQKVITATFYRLPSGKEPAREWLLKLPATDRKIIGGDLMAVEFGWPCGEPLCKSLSGYAGLREVRSDLPDGRIVRVFFYVSGPEMVLLHGFVKKSQKTSEKDLKLANKRKKEHERYETQKD